MVQYLFESVFGCRDLVTILIAASAIIVLNVNEATLVAGNASLFQNYSLKAVIVI